MQIRRRRATVRRIYSARATALHAGAGRPRGSVPPSQETDGASSRKAGIDPGHADNLNLPRETGEEAPDVFF